jgi:predicted patatin/cPLA2 family phospholipase
MMGYTIKGKLENITISHSQQIKIIRDKIKKKDQKKKIFEKNEERICHKKKMKSNYEGCGPNLI